MCSETVTFTFVVVTCLLVFATDDDVCQSPYLCRSNNICNKTGESYTCECPLGYDSDPASPDKLDPLCIGELHNYLSVIFN